MCEPLHLGVPCQMLCVVGRDLGNVFIIRDVRFILCSVVGLYLYVRVCVCLFFYLHIVKTGLPN